jgi:O-antigen/teichoic acid export membrane protein
MSVGVAMGSAQLVRLYLGEGFSPSGPILAVLAFNPVLVAFFEPYNTVVYAIEKHRYLVLSGMLGLAVLLITDVLLVPRSLFGTAMFGLGGLGAALGSLASQAASGIFQVSLARRYAPLELYWRGLKFAAAGLLMATVTALTQRITASGTVRVTAVALAIGSVTYLAMLVMLREFTRADARLFLDLLRPGKMVSYIHAELQKQAEREESEV